MTQVSEIKQALKNKRAVIGWNSVERLIKTGKAAKIFISAKASSQVRDDVLHYSKLGGFEVEDFKGDAYELGVVCKKPFPVSVLAVKES
jgi:large subunit ribosomal protein L30e